MLSNEQKKLGQIPDKVNLILGLFVFLFSTVIYLMTVQRTFSFWDCGEFVACAYIVGVPHPPGAPLWILIGRIFSLLPLAEDIGFRVNLISVFSTALASMFGYFIIVKLVKEWFGPSLGTVRRVAMYTGAVIGSLLVSFSETNWNSAIEAEVYGPALLAMVMVIWLTLIWAEKREEPGSEKYLILTFFLAVLSIGFHLTAYIVAPLVIAIVLLLDPKLRKNILFWITCFVLILPVKSLVYFIYVGGIWTALLLLLYFFGAQRRLLIVPMFVMLAAGVAFSVQFSVMIRAGQKPAINENAPATWSTFKDYLERKQYGQTSMIERMMTRRGAWENQFGRHERMGFWGFFEEQYGLKGTTFALTLFPLGLLGMLEAIQRRWKKGFPFFLMVLGATAGLVIYMNFADGTMAGKLPGDEAHLEVRDRDYFFQPGFVLFGLAIGLGIVALWEMLRQFLERRGGRHALTYALVVLLVLPGLALSDNYFVNDRSNNFISRDYAYNLLISADSNAVVFTNGDNDTFPVWCLQEVYGVRKDVRIANLSLLNTDWYIKQLKNEMGVPISLTDAQIEALRHERLPDGRVRRIQDKMIDNIVETNRWEIPIHFAVTVAQENRQYRGRSIEENLEMHGMVHRLKRETGQEMIDLEGTIDLYMKEFRYRGVADPTIYKDENQARLTNNYAAGFLYTADIVRRRGDIHRAIALAEKAVEVVPTEWRTYPYLMQLYADADSLHKVETLLDRAPAEIDREQMWLTLAADYRYKGQRDRAYEILVAQLTQNPGSHDAFRQLISYYWQDSLYDNLEETLIGWIDGNPSDSEAQIALDEIRAMRGRDTTTGAVKLRQLDLPGEGD